MDNLQAGQMVGPYRLINQIGKGGMATVYKAYQAAMDRYVAVKILPRHLAESPEFTGRFKQEAQVIAKLEHPHILPVFDFGEQAGVTYLVMRYLEAGTLQDRMQTGPLALTEIDRLFTQLADALGYAHQRGVIHRDLKPSNVMVDEAMNVFLTDFGIAKILGGEAKFTQTDAIIGTPAYISPEQAQGRGLDQRSDIYALGIVLYEMVTGRVPYQADTPLAVILKHVTDPLPLPSTLKPDLHPAVERVILKALAKDPADRFASCADFAAAWRQALQTIDAEDIGRVTLLQTGKVTPGVAAPPFRQAAPAVAVPPPAQRAAPAVAVPPPQRAAPAVVAPPPPPPGGVSRPKRRSSVGLVVSVMGAFGLFVLGGCFVLMLSGTLPKLLAVLRGGTPVATQVAGSTPLPVTQTANPTVALEVTQNGVVAGGPTATATTAGEPAATAVVAGEPTATEMAPVLPTLEVTATTPLTLAITNISYNAGDSYDPQIELDAQGGVRVIWYDKSLREAGDILYRQFANGAWAEVENPTSEFESQGLAAWPLFFDLAGQVCVPAYGTPNSDSVLGFYKTCRSAEGAWLPPDKFNDEAKDLNALKYAWAYAPDGSLPLIYTFPMQNLYFKKQLLSDGVQAVLAVALAVDKAGGHHAVWMREATPDTIQYRYSNDGGQTWTEPQMLAEGDFSLSYDMLRLKADAVGNLHLAWAAPDGILYRHWTPAGGWEEAGNASPTGASSFGLAPDARGAAHLVWAGNGFSNGGLWYAAQTETGAWSEPVQIYASFRASQPEVAIGPDGTKYFVFAEYPETSQFNDIYYLTRP